jgi:integrase
MSDIPRASVWQRAVTKNGETRLYWVVDIRFQGRRQVTKTTGSKSTALALAQAEIKKLAVEGVTGCPAVAKTLSEVFDEYLEDAKPIKRSWPRDVSLFAALKPMFGDKLLSHVTAGDCEKYQAQRVRVRSAATTNREICLLKHLFFWSGKRGYFRGDNPARIRLLKENNIKTRFLSAGEEVTLLANCTAELRPVVALALQTGLRKGELSALEWEDVDFDARMLHVRDGKGNKPRFVSLNRLALDALEAVPRHFTSGRVFFSSHGEPYKSFRTAFESALRASGLKGVCFHTLRHTFGSRLAQAGVSLYAISRLMGHSELQTTARYAHLCPDSLQKSVDTLADFCLNAQVALVKKAAGA